MCEKFSLQGTAAKFDGYNEYLNSLEKICGINDDNNEAIFKTYFLNLFVSLHYKSLYKFKNQFLPPKLVLNIFINSHMKLCKIIYMYLLEPSNFGLKKIKKFRNNVRIMKPFKPENSLSANYYGPVYRLLFPIEEKNKKKKINL